VRGDEEEKKKTEVLGPFDEDIDAETLQEPMREANKAAF